MKIVKIKNIQNEADTYCGQTILPNEYYQLQDEHELETFAEDSKVKQHLWATPAKILVNNGNIDLNAPDGDRWLDSEVIEINNMSEATPGDLVVTWSQMKSFYDIVSTSCMINYIDLSSHYYIWLKFQDQKIYVPELVKETEECIQFETSYKSKCNIPEWPRVRTTTCKAGRKMHCRYITFKTACGDPEWQFDNTDYRDIDFNDVTYTMKDASGNTTTDYTICKETWIDFFPTFTYELSGGSLFVDSNLTGDLWMWEAHVVAVPDIPANLGGCITFIANPRVEWIKGSFMEIVADNNPSELKYDATYKTNKIRTIIKHPIGAQANFQLSFRIFK